MSEEGGGRREGEGRSEGGRDGGIEGEKGRELVNSV